MPRTSKKVLWIGLIAGIFALFAIVAAIVGATILVGKLLVSSPHDDLLTTGQEADAVILEVRETGTSVDHYDEVEVLLEVFPENEPSFQVKHTTAIHRTSFRLYQPGSKTTVRYDPSDPASLVIVSAPVPEDP